jgi:hypothetical protein
MLAAATTAGHGSTAADASAAAGHTEAAASGTSDGTARWLGGAGLVVGALGLGVGVGATLRARKAGTAAASNATTGTPASVKVS